MNLRKRSERAVKQITESLPKSLTKEQTQEIERILQNTIIDAVLESSKRSSGAIMQTCSADADLAHKLNREIELAKVALIANLNALR